jgi:hypothetical protein
VEKKWSVRITVPFWGKGSVAATKCHTASESFTEQGLQKNFHDLAKTYQEMPIYGQVFQKKEAETLILS